MALTWISLPDVWNLQDVQAVLTVLISLLSAFDVFVFACVSWQIATWRVVKERQVSLSSLLTVSTLGEAVDIVRLLKLKILSFQHMPILAQCFVVVLLTAVACLSGPIARYSTRLSHNVILADVPGYLATNKHDSMAYANVQWSAIEHSLNNAGFPLDQLLDFVPDPESN